MRVFDLLLQAEGEDAPRKHRIQVANTMGEVNGITSQQYVQFHLCLKEWPQWLIDYAALPQEEQSVAWGDFSNLQRGEYYREMARVVGSCTTGGGFKEVLNMDFSEGQGDTSALEVVAGEIFEAIGGYSPQERSQFTHGGHTYVVPEKELVKVGNYEQPMYGKHLTVGSVVEAYHLAHIFGAKDEEGNDYMPDKRLWTELGMIASICRRKGRGGKLEQVNWGLAKYSDFVRKRMDALKGLPACVMVDVSFFLLNSLVRSSTMALYNTPSRTQRRKATQRKPWRIGRLFRQR